MKCHVNIDHNGYEEFNGYVRIFSKLFEVEGISNYQEESYTWADWDIELTRTEIQGLDSEIINIIKHKKYIKISC